MFLKKEEDPTSKLFEGVEWIRSLTEAPEISADVPEDSVVYDQQVVDPKKVRDPSDMQRLQADSNFQLGGPEKITGADDPRHALQKNGGLAHPWYMDDGDIMCHPVLVPSYLKVASERDPPKKEVIFHVKDLNAAPPE